jgi:hypothetical protein
VGTWPKTQFRQADRVTPSRSGKLVGLVCHAPVQPLVEGQKVTGFTDSEGTDLDLTKVVPFLVEDDCSASVPRPRSSPRRHRRVADHRPVEIEFRDLRWAIVAARHRSLHWIDSELKGNSRPTLIAVHHLLFHFQPVCRGWSSRLENWARPLPEMVCRHPCGSSDSRW